MIRTAPQPSLSKLIHELDALVSQVVRRSAADDKGECQCISCGAKLFWKQMDVAHYIDRGHMNTRFNLLNLSVACVACNRYNEDQHKENWKAKMTTEQVEYLEREGRSLRKLMRYELEQGIELMKRKLESLK